MFFFFLSCMFVTCPSLDLCGTEQQLMLARFVLYLESGHPDESIYLSCAWAFDFLTLRRAHSFALRCTHFGFLCYQYPPSLKKSHQTISCEREIDTRGAFVVIAGQRRNQFTTFQTHSDLAPDLEEKRHARAELPNHCKTASWLARCGSIREGFRATDGEATSPSLRDELP